MQLHIRGSSNYVLEFASGNESLAELKAKIYEVEGSEDVLLYVGGKPLDYEMPVSSIAEFHVDVTVMMSYLPIYYVSCNFANYTIIYQIYLKNCDFESLLIN